MERSNEDEEDGYGDRCPICNYFNRPAVGDNCKHHVGWRWDGEFCASKELVGLKEAWGNVCDLIVNKTENPDSGNFINQQIGGNKFYEQIFEMANYCDQFDEFLLSAIGAHVGSGWHTNGVLSGSGYNIYLEGQRQTSFCRKVARSTASRGAGAGQRSRAGMTDALFRSLDSTAIANDIRRARHSVCYAAPGIQQEPANAMAELARRIGPELITVCLDFDERVMRMGFGDLAAVKTLRDSGIAVSSTPGLRIGLAIVDDEGYIFTPTALYLEADQRPTEAPNALRLSRDQVMEALARLSPAAKAIAMASAKTTAERERIREQAVEVTSTLVADPQFAAIQKSLVEAPPVQFDVARQVRVFEPYLQYVQLRLTGAAIHRHRIAIPKAVQNLGMDESVQSRLKTTFDLIERESALSSKPIENELNEIRNNFTPSLGKDHGRVLLKAQKPLFEKRLSELRAKLEKFQSEVSSKLQEKLDSSRDEIIKYYIPRVIENPPDAFVGQLLTEKPTEEDARRWLALQLDRVFPKAEQLIQKMELEQTYKDVTFETLNKPDFLSSIRAAFPSVDWERTYEEYRAAGEKEA